MTEEEFFEKAKEVHGDKYDYSKTVFTRGYKKVTITCPTHGDFEQLAKDHLKGAGCRQCAMERVWKENKKQHRTKRKITTEEFIERAKEIHGDKYDYSEVVYHNMNAPLTVICPIHGKFYTNGLRHIHRKHGCPACNGGVPINHDEFLRRATEKWGDVYDFSESEYIRSDEKIKVICHKKNKDGKEHGPFWAKPNSILSKHGCPKCRNSHLEEKVLEILERNNIKNIKEKTFEDLKSSKDVCLRLDFYLPDHNAAIECQGIQHLVPSSFVNMGWNAAYHRFIIQICNDKRKRDYCKKHGIRLFAIKYWEDTEIVMNDIIKQLKNECTN